MCHLNMLKGYIQKRDLRKLVLPILYLKLLLLGCPAAYSPVEDNLVVHEVQMSCTRLNNSAVLKDLNAILLICGKIKRTDIMDILLCSQISPAQTTVLMQ